MVPELVPELASTVRFAVLVGGFEPMDPDMCAALLERGPGALKVRTLHVHGAADAMVSKQRCERLMTAFEVGTSEYYSHVIQRILIPG